MSRMWKIEAGVEIPENGRNVSKYPFRSMAVGESVLIRARRDDTYTGVRNRLSGNLKNAALKDGREFVTRREGNGVRVWRVK